MASLRDQVSPDGWHVDFLVIDNDAAESGRTVVDSFSHDVTRPLRYIVEPTQGVGTARNRALDESAECDALIFFDDDQLPNPLWLSAFLAAHESDPRTLWTGPVQPGLPERLPAWAKDGWPWRRPNYDDGSYLAACGDGNLLIPRLILAHAECRYSAEFGSGMGQDNELTRRLVLHGLQIRFCATASAVEPITSERTDPGWIIDRAGKSAAAWVRIELPSKGGMRRIVMSGSKHLARGMTLLAAGHLLRRPDWQLKSRCDWEVVHTYWHQTMALR